MRKNLLILICLVFLFSAFAPFSRKHKEKVTLYLTSSRAELENLTADNSELYFKKGFNIYFLLHNPEDFKSNILRLQVLKVDLKDTFYQYSISNARDVEIDKFSHDYKNYFCLHEKGYYVLRIFDKFNLAKPIVEADFKVE